MNERSCIRCHNPVLLQDGHLVYCTHCGAPQIFVSEQLQVELAETARSYTEQNIAGRAQPPLDSPSPGGKRRWAMLPGAAHGGPAPHAWTLGVQYALLSAGVALVLGLLSLVLPPLSLLLLLWIASAPILTVAFFQARASLPASEDAGFAARLGLLTGLLISFCAGLIFTLNLVLSRFLLHDAAVLDTQLAQAFTQQRAVVLARLGAEAKPTLDMFAVPEFRVGLLLSVLLISAVLYLLLSAIAGALAGLLLRRRRSA